jgi:hypothetical protein
MNFLLALKIKDSFRLDITHSVPGWMVFSGFFVSQSKVLGNNHRWYEAWWYEMLCIQVIPSRIRLKVWTFDLE